VSDFVFEPAEPGDDEALRRLVASEPVPGSITVSYAREPDYFAGCGTMGPFSQVLVCRHRATGAVAAVGCRAVRRLFVNGEAREIGYLGQLRIASAYQGRALLRQAFRAFRPLIDDGRVPLHVTTIIERNRQALGLLVDRPRPGLPRYREVGRLETLVFAARALRSPPPESCTLETGATAELAAIVAFLNREGRRRQFALVHDLADFAPDSTATQGFRLEDLFVARRHGAIVGVLGLWDQSAYKQSVVRGYAGALGRWRGALNLIAPVLGRPRLPEPGARLRHAYASFAAIEDDEPSVFSWLLRLALTRARQRGQDHVLLGLDSRDPLLPAARRLHPLVYPSRIYTVSWDDGAFHASLDGRPTRLEVATL
jgi:hypothetical protein